MKHFHNILYVLTHNTLSEKVLENAYMLADRDDSKITFFVCHPSFPSNLETVKQTFEDTLADQIKECVNKVSSSMRYDIVFSDEEPEFVAVIQRVLKQDHDLVIKAAEDDSEKKVLGFRSMDLSLLRKCPCPVWISRKPADPSEVKILTAIDSRTEEKGGHDLSIKLLDIGQTIANKLNGSNTVVSCWDFEHESFLRNSGFSKMQSSEVDKLLEQSKQQCFETFKGVIKQSSVDISDDQLVFERGAPRLIIPKMVEEEKIDIVVMGTVARTGVPGFIIGNTAENIIQNLSCSMFAVKPNGFVSPIKL